MSLIQKPKGKGSLSAQILQKFLDFNDHTGNQAKFTQNSTRLKVTNYQLHPFNSVGKIVANFGNEEYNIQGQSVGTGIIISQTFIITAAHVIAQLFNIGNTTYKRAFIANKIYFYLGDSKQQIEVIDHWISDQYFSSKCDSINLYDLAILQIQPNKKIRIQNVIKMNFNYKFIEMRQKNIMVLGYGNSSDDIYYYSQSTASSEGIELNSGLIYYKIETQKGTSGGPILMKIKEGQYELIGVHKGTRGNYNYGILLSNLKRSRQSLGLFIQNKPLQKYFPLQYHNPKCLQLKQVKQENTKLKNKNSSLQFFNKDLKLKNNQLINQVKTSSNVIKDLLDEIQRLNKNVSKLQRQNQNYRERLEQKPDFPYNDALLVQTQNNQANHSIVRQNLMKIYKNNVQKVNKCYFNMKDAKRYKRPTIQQWEKQWSVKLKQEGFVLGIANIKLNTNLNILFRNSQLYHIQWLNFFKCMLDDSDWKQLSQLSHKFINIKILKLQQNNIKNIKSEQLQNFKSLQHVSLLNNPLNTDSVEQLRQYKQIHNQKVLFAITNSRFSNEIQYI